MQALGDSVREMPGVENMSRLNQALEHEEEVQRYIEQGNLLPHEVALYVLEHGSTGQKISTVQHLDRTLKECQERDVAAIIAVINDSWKEDVAFQVAVPGALVPILEQLSNANRQLLLNGLLTMLEVRTEEVRKAWNELAVQMVPVLTPQVVMSDVVPLALKKADHSEPRDQRELCCALIGKMGTKLSAEAIIDSVLSKALALCQDTDAAIRVAMCEHLADVARAVGLDVTKAKITHELFELLVDEDKLVSRAAFTCLIDLIEFFDPPYRREHFYPIIRSYISAPPDEVLTLLIEEFGRFLWKIRSDIPSSEDTILFANFFRQCAQKPDQEVRRMCAYNLPAVVASLSKTTYPTHLTQITRALAVDTHPPVRRSIAAGLHELFTLLGDKASFYLKEPFVSLLGDPTIEVRSLLVQHLDLMLGMFGSALKGDDRDAFFNGITTAITNYESAVQKDWRKVAVLFKSFHKFPDYFSGQTIYEKFLPILVRHLQFGAAALKPQCAEFIVHFSKKLGNNTHVVDIFGKILNETFAKSTSCYNRISFIHLFSECCSVYSRKLVRDRLCENITALAEDPVPKVRLALVQQLPKLKGLMRPPVEDEYLKQFQKALQKLQADTDPEVMDSLAEVGPVVDELEKEYSRQLALRTPNPTDEANEKALEESEGNLLELAKEQEKTERRLKIREMLKEGQRDADNRPRGKRGGAGGPLRPGIGAGSTSSYRPGVGGFGSTTSKVTATSKISTRR